MSTERWTTGDTGLHFGSAEERRANALRAEQERAAFRSQQLASQSAPAADPEERIRIWEKLHELRLPRQAEHKLLRVIAAQTGLSVELVQQEQRRRFAARPAAPVAVSTVSE